MTAGDARARGPKSRVRAPAKAPAQVLRLALVGTLVLAAHLTLAARGLAQGNEPTSEPIKDWTLKCVHPQDAPNEQCILVQDLVDQENQQPVMQVAAGFWGPERKRGLVITLPLGITLPPGIELKVDGAAKSRAPFVTCTPNGCQSHVFLDDDLLQSMKAGNRGTVTFVDVRGRPVPVNFSLSGFTAGIARVK